MKSARYHRIFLAQLSPKKYGPYNEMMESFVGLLKSELFYGFENSGQILEEFGKPL